MKQSKRFVSFFKSWIGILVLFLAVGPLLQSGSFAADSRDSQPIDSRVEGKIAPGDVLGVHSRRKSEAVKHLTTVSSKGLLPCSPEESGFSRIVTHLKRAVQSAKHLFSEPEGVYSREEEEVSAEIEKVFAQDSFRNALIETFCKDATLDQVWKMELGDPENPQSIECLKKIHQASRTDFKTFAQLFGRFEGKSKTISKFLAVSHRQVLNEDFFGGAVTRVIKAEVSKEYFKKRYLQNVLEQLEMDLGSLGFKPSPGQKDALAKDLAESTALIGFNRAYTGKWASMKSDLDVKAYVIRDKLMAVLEKYLGEVPGVPRGQQLEQAYDVIVAPLHPKDSSLMKALVKDKSQLEKIGLDLEVDTFAVMDDARVDRGLNNPEFSADRAFWATVVRDNQNLAGSLAVRDHFMQKVKTDLAKSPQGEQHESMRRSHSAYLGAESFKPTHARVLKAIGELKKAEKKATDGSSLSPSKLETEAKKHILSNTPQQNWHYNLKTDACRFFDHVQFLETTHFLSNLCMFFQREKDRLTPKNEDYEHISRDEFRELAKDSRFREGYFELTRGFCEIKDFQVGNEKVCPILGDKKAADADMSGHSYIFFASVVEKLKMVSDQVDPDKNKNLFKQLRKKSHSFH